ncbi:GCG_CRPN prefix-to-repeats domain-containing protein [Camelimonas sp. ID_303_24]
MPGTRGANLAGQDASLITQVANGCGHGSWRAPNGRCVRGRELAHRPRQEARQEPRRPAVGVSRQFHGPAPRNHCFTQHTPHGPRRVCR